MATHRPKIVLLQLNKFPYFDRDYHDLLQALSSRADIETITTRAAADAFFRRGGVTTPVFATDESLALPEYRDLANLSATYVRNGGTLVFGAHFSIESSFSHDVDTMFASSFSLPWRGASYYRTDFDLNPTSTPILRHTGLPERYSMKAVLLKGVENSDAVYLPSPNPRPRQASWRLPGAAAEERDRDMTETPVAMARVGQGKLGYMGDINPEAELGSVVVGMLGLN